MPHSPQKRNGPSYRYRSISRKEQEKVQRLVEAVGLKEAARLLGEDVRRVQRWLEGRGKVTAADVRRITRQTEQTLAKTSGMLEALAKKIELTGLKGITGVRARQEIGRVRPMSPRAREKVFERAQQHLGPEAGQAGIAKAADALKKADVDSRWKRFLELATKKNKSRKERQEIVAILVSLGFDPHDPSTYIRTRRK